MRLTIAPDVDALVHAKLATGKYDSDEAVLRAALEALNREEHAARISEGHADIEAGRVRSFDESDAEFRKRHGLPPSSA